MAATMPDTALHQPRTYDAPGGPGTIVMPLGRRISWGAVIAGVTLALVVQVLLAMLGAGLGLSTVDPAGGGSPDAQTFGTAAGIWWGVSMLIALYIGGWVAGHMAGFPEKSDGRLHGLLVWGLTILLMLYLLSSAVGGVIGGAFNIIGKTADRSAQVAASAGSGVVDALANKAREAGINVDAVKSGQGPSEQQKAEAAQKGREAADKAASLGAKAGIAGFIALLLGAVAAAIGGSNGRPRNLVATR